MCSRSVKLKVKPMKKIANVDGVKFPADFVGSDHGP